MLLKYRLRDLILLILFIHAMSISLHAQINPLAAQYFQNPYLANPAMAGFREGIILNLGYRNQWSNLEGSPRNLSVTGEYGTEKVGIGINFYKDEAGLFSRSKVQASYAYHLQLDDKQKALHFGLSLGIQTEQMNLQDLVGSQNDLTAIRYNEQERIIDTDFGMAYTDGNITLEGAVNNLKSQLKIEDGTSNYATFLAALSYKIRYEDWQFQPKVIYHGVKGFEDLLDLGMEVRALSDQLGFMSLYHTNKSMSYGLSYQRLKQWQLLLIYNTPTQMLKSYARGTFEAGMQLNLRRGKKKEE
jgi:type IX secretion system PorP/SprF family membrane protein